MLQRRFDSAERIFMHFTLNRTSDNQMSSTRAGGFYDHGLAEERAIHDATLIFFTRKSTDSERDALFLYAVTAESRAESGVPVSDEITQTHSYLVELNPADMRLPDGHDRLEVFALTNSMGVVNALGNGHIVINTQEYAPGGITFGTLSDLSLRTIGSLTDGLIMTSAPLSDIRGGDSNPTGYQLHTLTEVVTSRLYPTISEADANPATEIFVERAAAKVQLATSAGFAAKTDDGTTFDPASIRWDIENENTACYMARHLSADLTLSSSMSGVVDKYRFIDYNPLQESADCYRTFWAVDYNYTGNSGLVRHYGATTEVLPNGLADVDYTMENTIDESSMIQDNTTGVVISVAFNGGADFYMLSLTGRTTLYTADVLKTRLLDLAEKTAAMKAWRTTHAAADVAVSLLPADGTSTKGDGLTVIPTGEVSFALSGEDLTPSIVADIVTEVEEATDIYYYAGGRAYYKVMIQHFGDDGTPLVKNDDKASTYDDLYGNPADKANFLGRYGVVRDTWYRIELSGIKTIGDPVVPDHPDHPDDDTEYLKLNIVILPWMLHEQNLDF